MICKNCGKTIQEGSSFCAHCGCDLRDSSPSNHSNNTEEQIPLLILARQIVKHKIAVIVSAIVVAIGIGGYIAIKKKAEKKRLYSSFYQKKKGYI